MQLSHDGIPPALYVSLIQPYCQAEYGAINQESRHASDRLDRAFPAPLSPALTAALQVPHRQAAAAKATATPRRQAAAAAAKQAPKAAARRQASEQPRGTAGTSMAAAAAPQEPQMIRPQRRRIRGISGLSSTESASADDFPGAPLLDTDTDRQADSVVKDEADLEEDAALANSLNTALPGRLEDDREVAATQEDEEEDEEEEGEEEEQQDEDEEEVAPAPGAGGPSSARGRSGSGSGDLPMPRVTGTCASLGIQGSASIRCSSNYMCPLLPVLLPSNRQAVSTPSVALHPILLQDSFSQAPCQTVLCLEMVCHMRLAHLLCHVRQALGL